VDLEQELKWQARTLSMTDNVPLQEMQTQQEELCRESKWPASRILELENKIYK
jgi:hypothetical protein